MNNGIQVQNCTIQPVITENTLRHGIVWDILRLDLIHPQISGNKYFKLKFALDEAKKKPKKGLLSFGGAWSNHILATSWACFQEGLPCIGIIRGEKPEVFSATLNDAIGYGMDLRFVPGEEYRKISKGESAEFNALYPDYLILPEGGYGKSGARGAAEITQLFDLSAYNYIFCASGTGTTLAGLIEGCQNHQHCIGISALKNQFSLEDEVRTLLNPEYINKTFSVIHGFHFGGYARYTVELIHFMNTFFEAHRVPTDFVYTGKLLFGITDLINNGFFKPESKILAIHSGGLQGNRSLNKAILSF